MKQPKDIKEKYRFVTKCLKKLIEDKVIRGYHLGIDKGVIRVDLFL